MRFYVLNNPDVTIHKNLSITDFLDVEPIHDGQALKCPTCGGFISGIPWLPPHRAELEVWGNSYGDIAFGPSDEILISGRLSGLYATSKLTGLEGFHEVQITRVIRRDGSRLKKQPSKYYCVTIARSQALINIDASGMIHEEPWTCSECRGGLIKRARRIVLEEDTWGGEDIFFARGLPGTILTSERFKEFFEKNKINNGILIPADQYSFDFYPWESSSQKDASKSSL